MLSVQERTDGMDVDIVPPCTLARRTLALNEHFQIPWQNRYPLTHMTTGKLYI
jgi:hypothetical protein